jgi:hypothetical protein
MTQCPMYVPLQAMIMKLRLAKHCSYAKQWKMFTAGKAEGFKVAVQQYQYM